MEQEVERVPSGFVEHVEGAIAMAAHNEARALAAIAEVEHWLTSYLKRCAREAWNSGSDFNQGVVRGLEIAAAQVEHSHYWNHPPTENGATHDQ